MSESVGVANINANSREINERKRERESSSQKYTKNFTYEIEYQFLSKVFKDIQLFAQLIKSIKNCQLSDIIFIYGNSISSVGSRFYFSYRKFMDFYVKVLAFNEEDKSIQVKFYVYKTVPGSMAFNINLTLFDINELSSKLSVEIIFPNSAPISEKISEILFNEINLNYNYLLEAIKSNKHQLLLFNSNIIKTEFFPLTQIIKNRKLIDYIINGKFEKMSNEANNDDKSFISDNEVYKMSFKKKSLLSDYINNFNVKFKTHLIKMREDSMIIQYKVLSDNKNNNDNNMNNIITIYLKKLTPNSTFILIKYLWDAPIKEHLILSIKNFINKILMRIEKLSKAAKQ